MFEAGAMKVASEFVSSLDQTTRIHGAVSKTDENGDSCQAWHELSRPQVHGHDLLDVAFLDPLKFISIADEKVARVFEAPRGFLHVINGLGVTQLVAEEVYFLHCIRVSQGLN